MLLALCCSLTYADYCTDTAGSLQTDHFCTSSSKLCVGYKVCRWACQLSCTWTTCGLCKVCRSPDHGYISTVTVLLLTSSLSFIGACQSLTNILSHCNNQRSTLELVWQVVGQPWNTLWNLWSKTLSHRLHRAVIGRSLSNLPKGLRGSSRLLYAVVNLSESWHALNKYDIALAILSW